VFIKNEFFNKKIAEANNNLKKNKQKKYEFVHNTMTKKKFF
jgi:hypothetical protein